MLMLQHLKKGWKSRPARGAWIEIVPASLASPFCWSRPARGAWIEIVPASLASPFCWSRPARGAWIEMQDQQFVLSSEYVAPRTGRVD